MTESQNVVPPSQVDDRPPAGPTVVCIVGPGRGGTTITGRLVATVLDAAYPGETIRVLDWRPFQGGPFPDRECGCGLRIRECPFWSRVFELQPQLLDPKIASVGEHVHAALINPAGIPRYLLQRNRWLSRISSPAGYREILAGLYPSIASVHGQPTVVTSASPRFVSLLQFATDLDIRVIQLTRDPRAVVQGWARRRTINVPAAGKPLPGLSAQTQSLAWDVGTVLAGAVTKREAPKYALVRYEDLMLNPRDVLNRALATIGLTGRVDDVITLRDGKWMIEMPIHHTGGANEIRFQVGPVELRSDTRWVSEISLRDKIIATGLTLPLAQLQGYPLWPRSHPPEPSAT